jgi:succinate dehydrogenase/fumarate reductase flavoprotein subunit
MKNFTTPESFDHICDVIVVGCGYAGAVAAIEAHDAGADVLILEKAPDIGGISICSAGGLRIAFDANEALTYLAETNAGTTDHSVLHSLAVGMTTLEEQVRNLAAVNGAKVSVRPSNGNYPFDGHKTFGFAYIDDIPGFDHTVSYPHVRGSPAGALLFKVLEDNLRKRNIPIHLSSPATRLLKDDQGGVAGLIFQNRDTIKTLGARLGVVLACGGFEGDPSMQRQFWQEKPVFPAAYRANTGDGIRMAQHMGAALWHMWHYHGSYGFQHPDPAYPFAIRTKRLPDWQPGEDLREEVYMPWILLNRSGRRFMNEYEPYLQDTGARPFSRFLPESQEYSALPCWLISDTEGGKLYPFGRPTSHERGIDYEWSPDNEKEIELGILGRADDLPDLANKIGVPKAILSESLQNWNNSCNTGSDKDFGRPPTSMMPIRTPPYIYGKIWPIVSNTQGGPVHDAEQRIIDVYGEPIPRLYAAGEMGSAFGHLYMSGGNLAECFIGGRTAGRTAAKETSRDVRT